LAPVLLELPVDCLQTQRILTGSLLVAGLQVGRGLGAEILLVALELAHLAHQPFGETGMVGKALVEVGDLLPEILFLQLHQRFGILPFDAADEDVQKRFEQIRDTSEHDSPCGIPNSPTIGRQSAIDPSLLLGKTFNKSDLARSAASATRHIAPSLTRVRTLGW